MRDYVAKNGLMLGFRRFRRVAGDLISYTGCNVISLGTSYLVLSSALELSSSTRAELKSHASLTWDDHSTHANVTRGVFPRVHPKSILSCTLARYQRYEYEVTTLTSISLRSDLKPLLSFEISILDRISYVLFRVTKRADNNTIEIIFSLTYIDMNSI